MSDPTTTPTIPAPAPRRGRWQVGLGSLLLLTAAVAVWLTDGLNRRHNDRLRERIAAARPLARELVVDDPSKAAVVKLDELWYDENRWDVYLPEGRYRVCLATREVNRSGEALAPVVASAPLRPGRHTLALDASRDGEGEGWLVEALVDGSTRLEAREPAAWNPGRGSSGGGHFATSTPLDPARPIVLFRRVFSRPIGADPYATPAGPAEGVLLWIEREP